MRAGHLKLVLAAVLAMTTTALPAHPGRTEILVVAGSQSRLAQLSREDVINIFMGGYRKLPDGSTAHPIDLDPESPARRAFYRRLLDKSLEEINAYWARLVFSGRTAPPESARDGAQLLERIARDPRAIGYIERRQLPPSEHGSAGRDVKVLFVLQE